MGWLRSTGDPRGGGVAALALLSLIAAGCYRSHERELGEDPRVSDCPSALLLGAPAPMRGYCPTRANRSAYSMPDTAPALRWTLELPGEPGTDAAIVVGPRGRIYVPAGTALIAIDDRGTDAAVAWTAELGHLVLAPVLLDDGSIFTVLRTDHRRREGVWLGADGSIASRTELPEGADDVLVGASGALFVSATPTLDERAVHALTPSGSPRWSRTFGLGSEIALAAGDRVVVGETVVTDELSEWREGYFRTEQWAVALDGETGEESWRVLLEDDALRMHPPAVGPDGAVYLLLSTTWLSRTLVVLAPDGTERRRIDLGERPCCGGPTSLSIAADGAVYVKDGAAIVARGAGGEPLWEREVHLNFDIGGTIDADGRLLVGHSAVDLRDGTELWVSEVPVHSERDGGITLYVPGIPVVGDGVLYYMASDALLYAVAVP